jgi:serine/threonine-protein kinase RsbW
MNAPEIEPARILVVDDRSENLRALEAVLEPLGRQIVCADSGREALRLLLDQEFAVILLDVQMPDMDGFETADYIRRRQKTRTVPIIFLTAISSTPDHVFRGYEAGAVDYIIKPVDPAILRSKVSVFVELYEKNQELARQSSLLRDREAAERRHRRARFLAAATAALEKRLDVAGRVQQLARVCVSELADLAFVALREEDDGGLEVAAVAHENKERAATLAELRGRAMPTSSLGTWVIDEPEARLFAEVTEQTWTELGLADDGALLDQLAPRCLIAAPLVLRGRTLGVIVLGRSRRGRDYEDEELEVAQDLARRAAMALENARLYEAERDRSRTLQLSLLGESEVENPAVTAAMRYVPGSTELEVGGDWYDVIEREDGRLVAVVGDVVGRGVQAATAMGKLRSAIAALALVVDGAPYLLGQLDRFAMRIPDARFATVAVVLLDPGTGVLRYSLAGHPPPLVVHPDGRAEFLDHGRGLPLGVPEGEGARTEATATLAPGATLVLFTDGLVERRDASIEEGLQRLLATAAERAAQEPEQLCDELIEQFVSSPRDDVVLVCLRLELHGAETFVRRFHADPSSIGPVRHELRDWLNAHELTDDDLDDVLVASGEACANAVRHAYAHEQGEATLEARLREGELTVRVRDHGHWREPSPSDERGRGILIMRGLMNSVYLHATRRGTTVVMRKRVVTTTPKHVTEASAQR